MDLRSLKRSFLELTYEEAKQRILETRAMRRLRVVKAEKVVKVTPAVAKKQKVKAKSAFDSLPPEIQRKLLEEAMKGKQ